jgi:DNA invertase Pin-like site-specific DNA recombinase
MQSAANQDSLASSNSPIDGLGSIVSEMISLIEHVQSSMAAIEAQIVREQQCSNRADAANVIVLADVTPRYARARYARARAALNACRASLCTTLNVLAGKRSSRRVIC